MEWKNAGFAWAEFKTEALLGLPDSSSFITASCLAIRKQILTQILGATNYIPGIYNESLA